jgi:hypothetical protein
LTFLAVVVAVVAIVDEDFKEIEDGMVAASTADEECEVDMHPSSFYLFAIPFRESENFPDTTRIPWQLCLLIMY